MEDENYVGVLTNSPIPDDAHAVENLLKTTAQRNVTHGINTVVALPMAIVMIFVLLPMIGTLLPTIRDGADTGLINIEDIMSNAWSLMLLPLLFTFALRVLASLREF